MTTSRIDGHEVEQWQVRFAGTIDTTETEADKSGLDRVVVWLCASRMGRAEFEILGESGELRRKDVAKISDAMVLTGQLRDQAINFLAKGGDQAMLHLPNPVYVGNDELPDISRCAGCGFALPPTGVCALCEDDQPSSSQPAARPAEPVTEQTPVQSVDQDQGPVDEPADTPAMDTPEVVGTIRDYRAGAEPEANGNDGPKVARFDPTGPGGPPEDREFVGSVYRSDRKGDPRLKQFLETGQ